MDDCLVCRVEWNWWWTHSRPKHVEKGNKHNKKNYAPIWLYLQDYTGMHSQQNIKLLCTLFIVHCQLKEEALDRTMWRNCFGRGFGPVVWQINDDDDDGYSLLICMWLKMQYFDIKMSESKATISILHTEHRSQCSSPYATRFDHVDADMPLIIFSNIQTT